MRKPAACLYLLACLLVLTTPSAKAYIDPSVTTYLVQAIAGVAIAVGAVFTLYWRKARKKIREKVGVGEGAKQEVEAEVEVFSDKENPS